MWVFAFRAQLRTFGNQTTNRIEQFFFLTVKSFFRSYGTSIAKQYHPTECVDVLATALDYKVQLACYSDFVSQARVYIMHDFPIPEIASVNGRNFTGFAAEVIYQQCKLCLEDKMTYGRLMSLDEN